MSTEGMHMRNSSQTEKAGTGRGRAVRASARGFTLMELCVCAAIVAVMSAVAIPVVKSTLRSYTLNTAVSSVTGAVQTVRYRAIANGYLFSVSFNSAKSTYQIQSDPTNTGNNFANVGTPVPFSATPNILGLNTTLVFRPGGAVQCPACSAAQVDAAGNWLMTASYLNVPVKTIAVSPSGRVNVTP